MTSTEHDSEIPTDLDAYRRLVRIEAMKTAADMGWCDDGLNRYLRDLGLPEKKRVRKFATVTLTYTGPVYFSDDELAADVVDRTSQGWNTPGYTLVDVAPAERTPMTIGGPDLTEAGLGTGERYCGQFNASGRWTCTMDRGHDGDHVAGDGTRVLDIWAQA